jgi:hypothetical protein
VEGDFKAGAEAVLCVLRKSRDTLSALLEAVLGDPLVEWGSDREAAAARRSLDVAVALNLLVSRCAVVLSWHQGVR